MSQRQQESLATAAAYLRDNLALRYTLGVADNAVLEPHFLGQGEHNENFWFADPATGEKYVLRVNVISQPHHTNQIRYEYSALEALAGSGCAPVPLYCDDTSTRLARGALVMSFCDAPELDFDRLRPGDIRCAVQLMADIHAHPVAADTPLQRPEDALRDLYNECVNRFKFYYSSAFEDPRVTRWMEHFIKAAEPALESTCSLADRSHMVNTETLPSHFLIPAASADEAARAGATGRFCAHPGTFVDWERPIVGEPAQDLAFFCSPTTTRWDSEFFFPKDQVEGLLEDYWRAVDGRFEPGSFFERFRAYRMVTALRSATWCCKAMVQYGTDGAYKTPKTEVKLPQFLSDEFMEVLARDCF